jgi:hypothetical protein
LAALGGGDPATVAVAIDVPHGPVVEILLERGFRVFAINPEQPIGSGTASPCPGPRTIGETRGSVRTRCGRNAWPSGR